jgi:hypothetical protein
LVKPLTFASRNRLAKTLISVSQNRLAKALAFASQNRLAKPLTFALQNRLAKAHTWGAGTVGFFGFDYGFPRTFANHTRHNFAGIVCIRRLG